MDTMNRVDRAKQFQSFDALKGLQEELRAREERRTRVAKKELSQEREEQISEELGKIYKRSDVDITFYRGGHYYSLQGTVLEKNDIYKYLLIGQERIYYTDIYELKLL